MILYYIDLVVAAAEVEGLKEDLKKAEAKAAAKKTAAERVVAELAAEHTRLK